MTRARERSFVAALCALFAGCSYRATQVLVTVDTDMPASIPATLSMCVESERNVTPTCRTVQRGARLEDGRVAQLPSSFTVRPSDSSRRDESVTVTVELRPMDLTRPLLRRIVRFRFVPQAWQETRVFLASQCATPTVGCRMTANGVCTIAQRCEEQGLTCGDTGQCVPRDVVLTPVIPGVDAAVSMMDRSPPPDAAAVMDASDAASDHAVVMDAPAASDAGADVVDAAPACMASGTCIPSACERGEMRCVANVPRCVSTSFVPAGMSCGAGQVCNGMGACVPCMDGAACAPATACRLGRITCSGGSATCADTGAAPVGTMCGPASVCAAGGVCVPCAAGASCTLPGNPCMVGMIRCLTGEPLCTGVTPAPVDTPCPGGICGVGGACVPCTEGASCPAPQCYEGVVRCARGAANCDRRPLSSTTPCDDGNACTSMDRCNGAGACAGSAIAQTENRYSNQAANAGDGVCVVERYYCSASGTVIPMPPPGGYYGGSGGAFCEYHACAGTMCQVNFCKSCSGDCASNCP